MLTVSGNNWPEAALICIRYLHLYRQIFIPIRYMIFENYYKILQKINGFIFQDKLTLDFT